MDETAVKKKIRYRANKAALRGQIPKSEKCEVCGKEGDLQGHHQDYNKPLEVLWVCRDCHWLIHKNTETIPPTQYIGRTRRGVQSNTSMMPIPVKVGLKAMDTNFSKWCKENSFGRTTATKLFNGRVAGLKGQSLRIKEALDRDFPGWNGPGVSESFFPFECVRCGHKWNSRSVSPLACPSCKNPKWHTTERLWPWGVKKKASDARPTFRKR